ncbi:hypothetical protein PC116_g10105 [Phytophthora cactorum]|uniref:Uncharacterized protein n=1 Tax=Phytophthora cactorum TaxID=29920 RepID=A0A8T1L042_9STRA|nr:hypothetical protein Pcac1_g6589 [Phytophthora cactorum]KAG2916851.1 hypothetical protein PC114_g7351 [Phytophthora cactorum]KAG2946831.1 hypothetical protein PC117_g7309 [Phytophthora cactorum]KAG3023671.1 hypothetical protein PC120_g7448 [Phytophthora cactorum]KAG3028502.1 hypothetical protein PC119_g6989 [Phytophthora cactorum]
MNVSACDEVILQGSRSPLTNGELVDALSNGEVVW